MDIGRSYIKTYNDLFLKFMSESDCGYLDESAIPSYTHSNKLMSYLFWKRIKVAFQLSGDIKGCSVLDFGCGCGVTFKYFDAFNCDITACENRYCEMAQRVCDALDIEVKLYEDLCDIKNVSFDRIFGLDVLEHVDDLEKYVNILYSLLNPGGKVIVSGPTENIIYKIGRKLAGFSGHYHVRNIYEIEKVFSDSTLQRTSLKILPFPISLFRISAWVKVK